MSKWIDWIPEQKAGWIDWVASRPKSIQDMVEKYSLSMDNFYRLKNTGQIVILHSLNENGTVAVNVDRKHNWPMLDDLTVTGVNPGDLEIYDSPTPPVPGRPFWDAAQGIVE